MKKKTIYLYLMTNLSIIFLAGCWDSNEPERMVYVHGVGIDYKDNKYVVYVQLINPSLSAKTESAGGEKEAKIVVIKGVGKTINQALFNVYLSTQRRVFWGHVSFYIFTKDALNTEALRATVDQFDRYRETRYNTYIFGTDDPLSDLLKVVPPFGMSTSLSRLSDPKSTYEQSSIIKPIDLRELLISLNEPPKIAAIPYVKLSKPNTVETEEKNIRTIRVAGLFYITESHLKDIFSLKDLKGIEWMNGKLARDEINLKNELADISIIVDKIKVKKIPIIEGEKVRFRISIEAQTKLSEIIHKETIKKVEKETEKLMKAQIKDSFQKGLINDVDVYRLSETLYRKKVHVWKKIQKNGEIPLTEDSLKEISISVKINHGEKQRKMPTLQ